MKDCRLSLLTLGLLSSVAFLSACDAPEGWEWQQQLYKKVPYTMERTAGAGVAWVLVKMAPPRQLVIVPETPKAAPILEPVKTEQKSIIQDAEPLFEQKTKK